MIVRLATHADRLPKSSQRRSCLLAEPKDTAKSLDEAISVQPLVNSRGAGLAYDFFRFLRRPLQGLWACSDPDCHCKGGTALDSEEWQYGMVYGEPRQHCDCGSPVYELRSCNDCNTT